MMRNKDRPASLIKTAVTVFATVAACATILFLLQPGRTDRLASEGKRTPLSAATQPPLAAATEKPQLVLAAGDIATEDEQAEPEEEAAATIEETATGGEIRLASRRGKVRVPLPKKNQPVPLPVRNDLRPKKPADAAVEEPVKAEAIPQLPLQPAAMSLAAAVPAPEPAAEEPAASSAQGHLPKSETDAALAPLLSYAVPDGDLATLKEFVKTANGGDYSDARALIEKLRDPVAVKLARWYFYRKKAPDTTAQEIDEFVENNPRWPNPSQLREAAEDALFWREDDPANVVAYFSGRQPASGAGIAALGAALIEQGRNDEGTKLVRDAWRRYPLTEAIEKNLRKLKVLNDDDHRARADYLLMQDNRAYLKAVKRLMPLIDKTWHASLKARIATVERAKNAGTLLSRLDTGVKREPGVLLARIQWLRRADEDERVWSLLRSAPKASAKLIDAGEWWEQRASQVRLALNDGRPKTAYALASEHGSGLDHEDLSEAEFLSGWIALRFLERPEAAREHFLDSAAAGGLPKRRARAAYWLARTELALGNKDQAIARFAEAAQHSHAFYGQLAHQMIAETGAKVAFRTFVPPTKAEIEDFVAQDVMKAIILVQKADLDSLLPVFLYDLARRIESAPEMILLCELAVRVAPRHQAVRMAKVAMNRDFAVEHYAYPNVLSDIKGLHQQDDIEHALVHALTRQESEFNASIVSSAGAVGLMQLLPSTAKLVAKQLDLKFSKAKLADDPAYNVSLGTAFLHSLIRNYDGSYIMALAGYNAGPGRVRQWVRQFGDPRTPEVDPVDWVERIPFTETREYVHKIMESAQIYRSRLLGEHAPLRLAEDLHRGREDQPKLLSGMMGN
jgi:soluble lytic murein transglycosylase